MQINLKTDKIDLKQIVRAQKQRSIVLRSESISTRKQRLRDLKRWILANRDQIHEAVFLDLKKPAEEADLSEVYPVLTELRHTLSHLNEWAGRKPRPGSLTFLGTRAWIQPEPKGVCLIISPWNYPFNLAIGPLVSALAAGNTAIIKPSEFTPYTNAVIKKMITQLFNPEVCTLVEGEADVATALIDQPPDHIFFTGSPQVGMKVMESAAKHLTSVTLELGGKSPTIIDESASIKDAAMKVAWGKWLNAGQTCVAPDYLFVHRSKSATFIEELQGYAKAYYGQDENYTGIINERHYQRLNTLLRDAIDGGAEVVFGGKVDEKQNRIYPLVLTGVQENMQIMQEEVFGPLLPILVYDDLSRVIDLINSRPNPLALYLFTKKRNARNRMLRETSAGTVVINDCVLQFAHPTLPFGGTGVSGFGKAHGKAGFMAFSNEKSVLKQRTGFTMAKTVYPPYTRMKKWMIEVMLKYF